LFDGFRFYELASSVLYLSSDCFDIKRPAMISDEEQRAFEAKRPLYTAVGQAISAWAGMESSLVVVAGILMETPLHKVGLILYSNQNFYGWLNIIDGLFEIEPKYSKQMSMWGKISNDLRKMNDTRVRLAHHTSHHKHSSENADPSLMPGRFDVRSKTRKLGPLSADEIVDFTEKVSEVIDKIADLLKAMRLQQPSSPHKSPQPSDDQRK
jgi:hypothetical protein